VPRYQQASPIQKTLLLDAFVEWTGYTRKHAIKLLNHGEPKQQVIQRHRLPTYRQAVQQALLQFSCANVCKHASTPNFVVAASSVGASRPEPFWSYPASTAQFPSSSEPVPETA
jgi:hypothetical protein